MMSAGACVACSGCAWPCFSAGPADCAAACRTGNGCTWLHCSAPDNAIDAAALLGAKGLLSCAQRPGSMTSAALLSRELFLGGDPGVPGTVLLPAGLFSSAEVSAIARLLSVGRGSRAAMSVSSAPVGPGKPTCAAGGRGGVGKSVPATETSPAERKAPHTQLVQAQHVKD